MRCLYCLERGASSEAVAICPACGAAACVDHVVRAVVPVGITSERSGEQQLRGPLRCHYCAGMLAVHVGPARKRGSAPGLSARYVRLPRWRPRRQAALTAADVDAAVRAAERILLGPMDVRSSPAVSRRSLWQRLWLVLTGRRTSARRNSSLTNPGEDECGAGQ